MRIKKEITNYIILGLILLTSYSCNEEKKVILETVKVERGDVCDIVTATGTLECITKVDVGTQVTGIISKLYVDYNSKVTKGQLIAELEKTLLESEYNSATSNMESAKLTYEYNKKNYERDNQLHEKQLISDYDYETSRKDYMLSKSAYDKSISDRVKAAKNLNYTEIYSPIDGIVISREVEEGQTVVSSMNVANLYTIADLSNMQVVADVDEADIGAVKVGQNSTFMVDAFPNDVFSGKVTQVRLSPTTTSNVVTYQVVVEVPNPDLKLIPGLTANITINVKENKNVMLLPLKTMRFTPQEFENAEDLPQASSPIPQNPNTNEGDSPKDPALATSTSKRLIWLVRDNKLIATEIELGEENGVNFEVKSGVKEGDVVALQYSTEEKTETSSEAQGANSPFMPKPPGGNNKK
ncbi:MAG: efflux RND transporter periplasmic adaptor subunit [Muribaculaceae bacterium]|nr:efflux RND transporter periplasmic adaptor subunit [Muribaculaceae bacterium]